MYCSNCGESIEENSKFCYNCGMPVVKNRNGNAVQRIQLRCNNCNSVMKISPGKNVLICEHCGSKELVFENVDITIERLRSESEKEKQKTARRIKEFEFQQHESQKNLEMEKLYYNEKKERRKALWGFKVGAILWIVAIAFLLAGISIAALMDKAAEKEGKIHLPDDREKYIGMAYQTVELEYSDAGFTNIETKGVGDLDNKKDSKNGKVYKIMINGYNIGNRHSSSYYYPDEPVIIYFHSVH